MLTRRPTLKRQRSIIDLTRTPSVTSRKAKLTPSVTTRKSSDKTEVHHVSTALGVTGTTVASQIYTFGNVLAGPSESERVANSITHQNFEWRCALTVNALDPGRQSVRIITGIWKQAFRMPILSSWVLDPTGTGSDILKAINSNQAGNLVILGDEYFNLNSGANTSSNFPNGAETVVRRRFKYKAVQTYDATGATSFNNFVHFVLVVGLNATASTHTFNFTNWYTDS